jgi:hypothetical protein
MNFSNVLLSTLAPYADEIVWGYQCGFQHKTGENGGNAMG